MNGGTQRTLQMDQSHSFRLTLKCLHPATFQVPEELINNVRQNNISADVVDLVHLTNRRRHHPSRSLFLSGLSRDKPVVLPNGNWLVGGFAHPTLSCAFALRRTVNHTCRASVAPDNGEKLIAAQVA